MMESSKTTRFGRGRIECTCYASHEKTFSKPYFLLEVPVTQTEVGSKLEISETRKSIFVEQYHRIARALAATSPGVSRCERHSCNR